MTRFIRSVLVVVFSLPLAAAADRPAAVEAMLLAGEAATAADAQDNATFLAKMEAAAALRPDIPRLLVALAAAQTANDRPEDAVATLARLAALGQHAPVETAPEFAPLRERKDFQDVAKKIAANLDPKGDGEIAFSLPGMTGAITGLAWRERTGEFFFGDAHHRCVWVRAPKTTKTTEAPVRRFTPEGDALWGVLGLAIDEANGILWAATSAVPAMDGFSPEQAGTAGLAEIDLATGEVRRVMPIPRREGDRSLPVLGDLALARDGTVYLTDRAAPLVWRLAPGAAALELVAENPEFMSLRGVVVTPDGGTLFLADHANGLLRLDLASGTVLRLETPPDTTLIGLDALVRAPNGDLIAIQSGLYPKRVLRLTLGTGGESVARVTVLESGHLTMAEPALGCIAPAGRFFFIGNSGASRFEAPGSPATAPRRVPVFQTKF